LGLQNAPAPQIPEIRENKRVGHAFFRIRNHENSKNGSAYEISGLACGARLGVLPPAAGEAARRALATLYTHLTPDGLLDGVAQSNRGGEALQRSDYRVLAQMGMGLLAQLIAEVGEVPDGMRK